MVVLELGLPALPYGNSLLGEFCMTMKSNTGHEVSNADLIICGGGGAGLAAAVAAAENGIKKVFLFEKRGEVGGNTAFAFNFFGINSPAQKRAGINTTVDEYFTASMDWSHWRTNPKITRAFAEKSGGTIQWLEDKGLRFVSNPLYIDQKLIVSHRTDVNGAGIIAALNQQCKKLGVRVMLNTAAKKLILDSSGAVSGLKYDSAGSEFTVKTRAVIIATGGYGANRDLLKKYFPDFKDDTQCGGLPHTGDGLLMALDAGAAMEGMGFILGGGGLPGPLPSVVVKVGAEPDVFDLPLVVLASEPEVVWVNNRGERFADETLGSFHPVASLATKRQPDRDAFTIMDQNTVDNLMKRGLLHGYLNGHRKGVKLVGLADGLKKKVEEGWVKISDSWSDIGEWIGAKSGALESTINEYNAACDRGCDPVYAKERKYLIPLKTAPYYVIRNRPVGDKRDFFLDTFGGIRINERMEVLEKHDNPVPGLYAAGVVTGGWEAVWKDSMLSGNGASFAINSGRIAAENAAAFLGTL